MSPLNPTARDALRLIVSATLEAIAAAGPGGAPAGPLYAALMTYGCTLNQFESLMGALERCGKIRRDGDLLHLVTEETARV